MAGSEAPAAAEQSSPYGGMPNPPPAFPSQLPDVRPPEPPSDQRREPASDRTPPQQSGDDAPDGDGEPRQLEGRSWFDRLLGRPGAGERGDKAASSPPADEAASDAPPAAATPDGTPAGAPPAPGTPGTPAPTGATQPTVSPAQQAALDAVAKLSPDEQRALFGFDNPMARLFQSRVDSLRAREQAQGAQSTWNQRKQQLAAQELQTRQTDAYQAAELRNQLDAMQQQEQTWAGITQLFDRVSLDPIVSRLPKDAQAELLAQPVVGMEGREALTKAALDRYEAHIRAEEATKLRRNPAFRKEVLNERRGQVGLTPEEAGEPELVTNGAPSRRRGTDMDSWLRERLQT